MSTRCRAVSERKKKERELTVQEKRDLAEKVMEAATRRRDQILRQRSSQCGESPQASPAGRCAEQLATEVADTVIEHALLDQRMRRASTLKSQDDARDLVRHRRDRAREVLLAQMGRASRRKAALVLQQDRGTLLTPTLTIACPLLTCTC